MKLIFERLYPYIIALISAFLWNQHHIVFPKGDSIISSTLTVSGIFVGFLATSKSILISMNSSIISEIKKSGYMNDLVSYIGHAIWSNLAFCSFNVIAYFIDTSSKLFGSLWVFIGVSSLFCFIRVTHIMLKVFKYGNA